MPSLLASDVFVGRAAELGLLRTALERARCAQPAVVLVHGRAGIGKTALIRRFIRESDELSVIEAQGDETESGVPYAVIDQLLRRGGVIDPGLLAGQGSEVMVDPVSAGSRVLEMLGVLQATEPVLLVLDDAQCVDGHSLRALLFALRRLAADRVLAVVAARTEGLPALPDGLRRLVDREPGRVVELVPFGDSELAELAAAVGVRGFTRAAARRLREHTAGNPLHARELLSELPEDFWDGRPSPLPAPRSFEALVLHRLATCRSATRRLIEAASVLGLRSALRDAGRIAGLDDPLRALDEAVEQRLLGVAIAAGAGEEGEDQPIAFEHPLAQSAIYAQIAPGRRAALHRAAAAVVEDEWVRLRHRAAAVATCDDALADELERFAAGERTRGAWAHAAASLIAASRVSASSPRATGLLLRAVDSMLYHGDVAQAAAYGDEIEALPGGPRRDCVLGFLALLSSRPAVAEQLLGRAWEGCDPRRDPALASTIARRTALHFQYRLRGRETMMWSSRAIELAPAEERSRARAELLPLGVGAAYAGRIADGLAAVQSAMPDPERADSRCVTLRRARGWLRLVSDDFDGARADLSAEAEAAVRIGSLGVAAFALVHLARVEHLTGNWDASLMHAERAIVITSELEHPFTAFARLAAAVVTSMRGDWAAAEAHVRQIACRGEDYEQSIVAAGIAGAQLAAARADHAAVLEALAPVQEIEPREGVDEPGCWPWQHLYAHALVASRRLSEADAFLAPHEARARERGHLSAMVRLASVRARLSAAGGDMAAAAGGFEWAVAKAELAGMPFDEAAARLEWGVTLRRRGRRRAAAAELESARATFTRLGARPYRERCEAEITASGLTPAKRRSFDRDRLTPQEQSVARLVSAGRSNRQVATELVVSVRTVEFHLTRIYGKLGLSSRAQLAAVANRGELGELG